MSEKNNKNVSLGKIVIAQAPAVLITAGIGSCVMLCLYHPDTKTGGAAHIMLPHQNDRPLDKSKPAKYADVGTENILNKFKRRGIELETLKAKLVGGAQLFHYYQVPNIGEQNIRTIKKILREHKIPIVGYAVGGHSGRSVWFYCEDGKVIVRSRFNEKLEI
ncbi:chemotaxis protein CheD [bacterium]|nr:MAG: chemotaxis protein CheD [bacterium]